jgi:hypothetical protein
LAECRTTENKTRQTLKLKGFIPHLQSTARDLSPSAATEPDLGKKSKKEQSRSQETQAGEKARCRRGVDIRRSSAKEMIAAPRAFSGASAD